MTTNQISYPELRCGASSHQFAGETIELPPRPGIYRDGKYLVLENGADFPSNRCVKSGMRIRKRVNLRLCSPFNPFTWFFSRKRVMIGLSARQYENHMVLRSLAWSLVGLGIVMTGLGLFSGIGTAIAGTILLLAGAMIRAGFPVWGSNRGEDCVVFHGCGEPFLRRYQDRG